MEEEKKKPTRKKIQAFLTEMAISPENTYAFQEASEATNIYLVDNENTVIKSYVKQNTKISISNPDTTVLVIRPFTINIEPSGTGGYLATSDVSYAFEVETAPSQVRKSYLKSLVEDIVWFQQRYPEYIATSSISNGFELEATPSQARESHLRSLVDDLVWLQKRKEELSLSILEELHLLQHYIQIIQ